MIHAKAKEPPRRSYLGGSDAAAVVGVSPWKSAYRLWLEKSGAEPAPSLDEVEYVRWGTLLEPLVAQEWARRSGKTIRIDRALHSHRKWPFLCGHIDRRVLNENSGLECKISNAFDSRKWGPDGSSDPSDIPPHYLTQIDHYMALGFDRFYVAVLIGGNELRSYCIERSLEREAQLVAEEVRFWSEYVVKDSPPPVLSEADARHRWQGVAEGSSTPVDLEAKQRCIRLAQVEEERKLLQEEEQTIRDYLFPLFTDTELLSYAGEPIARLRPFTQERFSVREFAQDKSAAAKKLYRKYLRKVESKRFKILC